MPIYEYRCTNCGHELEAIQKVSEAPLVACPVCQHDALKKKVSAAGFRLKGGGWYETDFKSGKKKNVSGEDAASGADKSAADAKSEAKGASESGAASASKSDSAGGSAPAGKSEAS